MLLQVQDASSNVQVIIAHSQDVAVDGSGTIATTGVAQNVFAQNAGRSGWLFQNLSSVNSMRLNELGPAAVGAGSFIVPPLGFFPPPNYPVPVGIISVVGTDGDSFTARQWS